MKYRVSFRQEECKGCELCIEWCPKKILALDMSCLNKGGVHPATITNPEDCIGCANCGIMCPDAIITIEKIDD